jgi:hypothetical protein
VQVQRRLRRVVSGAFVLALVTAAAPVAAQPSTDVSTYVLFGGQSVRLQSVTALSGGNVGVNDGLLYTRNSVPAHDADFAAMLAHIDSPTQCHQLFTNALIGGAPGCPRAAQGVPTPIVPSLAAACSFPLASAFGCNGPDQMVDHNQITTLGPGKYGNLVVEGGGAGPGTLRLTGGSYSFCSVRISRGANVSFGGPSTVTVAGNIHVNNGAKIVPVAGVQPGAINWFVAGAQVRLSRSDVFQGYLCAPNGKLSIGAGDLLTGHFVANNIRMKRASVHFAPPVNPTTTTTTTTTVVGSTTTTTLQPCTTDHDCSSAGGVFICVDGHCVPGCQNDGDCNKDSPSGSFVCVDGHCVPGTSTTTTPTTSSSSTTSTTMPGHCTTDNDCPVGRCVDGMCKPECTIDADCNQGSASGSFVCENGRCVPTGEICGDCIDNDGNGLTDFEDPACCSQLAGEIFPMTIKKGKLRPMVKGRSLLRMRGTLARSGLAAMIDPPNEDVFLQIRQQNTGELLCAKIPTGKFVKLRKIFRYSRKKNPAPPELAHDLDKMKIKVLKNGQVRFAVKGKGVLADTPPQGAIQVTIGFRRPAKGNAANVCSSATRAFRSGKKNAVIFP